MATVFNYNTVVICYNCRRLNIGTIKASWKAKDDGKTHLSIIIISCSECVQFPHVFNPSASLWRRYVDVRRYMDLIIAFGEEAVVSKERRYFSVVRLRFRTVAQVQDCRKVGSLLESARFAAVGDRETCGFFGKDSAYATSKAIPILGPQSTDPSSIASNQATRPSSLEIPPAYSTMSAAGAKSCPAVLVPKLGGRELC